jgi:hypothetical protein
MKKLDKKKIKLLATGEVILRNNGSLEDLHLILENAFPKDSLKFALGFEYYFQDFYCPDFWLYSDEIPTEVSKNKILNTQDFFIVVKDVKEKEMLQKTLPYILAIILGIVIAFLHFNFLKYFIK